MNNMFLFAALLHLKETKNPPICQAANRGNENYGLYDGTYFTISCLPMTYDNVYPLFISLSQNFFCYAVEPCFSVFKS